MLAQQLRMQTSESVDLPVQCATGNLEAAEYEALNVHFKRFMFDRCLFLLYFNQAPVDVHVF